MALALLLGTAAAVAALVLSARGNQVATPARRDWQSATVPALREAEELLDALENRGFAEREVIFLGNSCIAVRWR